MRPFVSERRAVDPVLSFSGALINAVVFELPPNKESCTVKGSQHDLSSGAAEQFADATIGVAICRVVLFVERKTVSIAVLS